MSINIKAAFVYVSVFEEKDIVDLEINHRLSEKNFDERTISNQK